MRVMYPFLIKVISNKPTANVILNSANTKAFSLGSGTIAGSPLFITTITTTVVKIPPDLPGKSKK